MAVGELRDFPLLERQAELALLESALAKARDGVGALVMLEGHAGAGKTRLAELAVQRAGTQGMQALVARGTEGERGFPFGVALQLLERRLGEADPVEYSELTAGAAALARPLLEGAGPSAAAGPDSVFTLQHGLYWLIANLADRAPVLLVIDDAHWADVPSLRFLFSLAHRLEGLAIALVIVRRLGEDGEAEEWLDRLAASSMATVHRLRPLTKGAVTALVRTSFEADADDRFCDACARAVRGNPLYLRELLAELRTRGIPAEEWDADQIPRLDATGLTRSIGSRLERLGRDAVVLAEAASVVESGLPLRLAAQLADLPHNEASLVADALAEADILSPEEPLRFSHPVVRSAVYARLTSRRRARMHRRVGELLRDDGAEPERIAAHLEMGELRGEEWAARALQAAAARAVERGAHGSATAWLERALAEGPPADLRAVLTAQLGLARAAGGDLEGVTLVRQAATSIESPTERARYLQQAVPFRMYFRRYSEAAEIVRAALAEVDDDEHQEVADEVAASLVCLTSVTEESDPAALRRVIDLHGPIAGRPSPPATPRERLILCAMASWGVMTAGLPAAQVVDLAKRSLSTAPDHEVGGAMFHAIVALHFTDAYGSAEAALERSIEAARQRGFLHFFTVASFVRADTRYRAGDVSGACADGEAAMEGVRQGVVGFEPPIRGIVARCLLDRGDLEGARRMLDLPDPERWSGHVPLAFFYEARGHAELAAGQAVEARASFLAAGAVLERIGALNPAVCAWRSGAALAERALGEDDAARRLAADEVERARAFGGARAMGIALRVQGLVLGGDEGVRVLDEAVEVLEGCGSRLEHARALLARGALKRRAGHRRDAREDLRRGVDRALACHAPGVAAMGRGELLAAGGRPRRERLHGPAALTPRERQIAGMASEGLTNREIAQALFVTRRTVEAHLHSAYAKLEISSRAELPEALRGRPA